MFMIHTLRRKLFIPHFENLYRLKCFNLFVCLGNRTSLETVKHVLNKGTESTFYIQPFKSIVLLEERFNT